MNKNHIIRSNQDGEARLGVLGLQAILIDLPKPSDASAFLTALGLRTDEDGLAWFTAGGMRPCIGLSQGSRKRLKRLVFACLPGQLAPLRGRAVDKGHAPFDITGSGFSLCGPDGIEVEFVVGDTAQHGGRPDGELLLARAPSRSDAPLAEPIALSHAAIFVSDVDAALAFYAGVIGLRLSDRCGSELAFLHAPHGSDHHVLALVGSSGPGLHHYSFEMGTVDAIGLRAAHMAEQGFDRGWGMGRHVLGSNFFHYVRDPWGSHAELTAGLEYIAADAEWVAGDNAAHDAFYLWGPPPPLGFIDNPEAIRAEQIAAA